MSKKTAFQETLAGLESQLQELIKGKTAPYAENTFEFLCKFMEPTNAAILASLTPHYSTFLGEDMLTFRDELERSSMSPEKLFLEYVRRNIALIMFTDYGDAVETFLRLQDLEFFVSQLEQEREAKFTLLLRQGQAPDQP